MKNVKSRETWRNLSIRDKIQQVVAGILIASGIVIAFLSFFLNNYEIADSVLVYIGESFVLAGSLFGVGVYVNHKLRVLRKDAFDYVDRKLETYEEQSEGRVGA
jgi:hypothetical protein